MLSLTLASVSHKTLPRSAESSVTTSVPTDPSWNDAVLVAIFPIASRLPFTWHCEACMLSKVDVESHDKFDVVPNVPATVSVSFTIRFASRSLLPANENSKGPNVTDSPS